MGNFFHLQRLLKSLEDSIWSLLLPQTTVASLRITDDWWETQHILFPRGPVQGGGRQILIQEPPDFSGLWQAPATSLPLTGMAGCYRLPHVGLCPCQAVLQSSANPGLAHHSAWGHLGSAGVWGSCHLLTKHQHVLSPQGMQHQSAQCLSPHISGKEPLCVKKQPSSEKGFLLTHFSFLD